MPDPSHPVDAAEFAALMQRLGPFERAPRLAVACSGGPDSLALAVLAARWATERGGNVIALIVDHGLREASSAEAAATVRRLTACGIAAEVLPWAGPKPTTGVQAAARAARYELLQGWCRAHGVLHLLTAHHLDDQAETLLMRLARGGGGDGLAATAALMELTDCRLLRPLLTVRRDRLAATLRAGGLAWVDDPSNDDPRYERVRVRRALAVAELDPVGLAASAAGHARARAALEAASARMLAEAASLSPAGFARLDSAAFATAPEEVARRALARLLQAVGGRTYAPAADALGRMLARIVRDGDAARGTLGGCRLASAPGGRLLLAREARNLPASRPLAAGERFRWDGRFDITCPVSLRTRMWLAPLGRHAAAARHLPFAVRAAAPAVFDADGMPVAVVATPHPPAESLGFFSAPRLLSREPGFMLRDWRDRVTGTIWDLTGLVPRTASPRARKDEAVNFSRNIALWLIIGLLLVALFNLFQGSNNRTVQNQMAYSEFMTSVEAGEVRDVTIKGQSINGHLRDGRTFASYAPEDANLVPKLREQGVRITAQPSDENSPTLWGILISWFPMLLLIAVWIFFMRQMQGGGGKAMGFGKSRAKLLTEKTGRVTFDDVAGIDEAKQELEEIVEFLKDPQKFQRLGGQIPKGVLLVGPPGTGKTLLARAIAGEANVPFFTISGSDFVEMFVGVGASRVRDMFEQGKKNAPCLIFIDEIDAVGRHRGAGLGGGNDEREQTLNQLLVEMDGFEANEGVILIAATNRPDVLDPALLRPGRFDRQVVVPNPDIVGRERILRVHLRKVPLAPDVDPRIIARGTPGFSGADLANLTNEAALLAARRGKRVVTMQELEDAKDKVMMGAERRSMVMTEDEKRLTAYHEGGHALVSLHMPKSDPLHKVTIIPRGRALGVTMNLPERDQLSLSEVQLTSKLAMMFGGRMAEEIVFGKENVTTGAGNDIQQATSLARRMVTEFGFSDKLGRLRYADNEEEVFLGHSVARQKHVSDATAAIIDQEVRRLIDTAEDEARRVLIEHREELDKIADGLLEYETLSGEEVQALLRGEEIHRPSADDTPMDQGGRKSKSSVPSTGKARPKRGGGLGPEPQPGQ